MKRFGEMKKILSLFLGAMSFGAQGAYAKDDVKEIGTSVSSKGKNKGRNVRKVKDAMRKKRSKGKNAKAGIGRRGGEVNVDGNKALRIIEDAKSKGHRVNVEKIGRNRAEVTVTDENGNTVTYVVGGVSIAVIVAVIAFALRSKGTQKSGDEGKETGEEGNEKKEEEDKKKAEEEAAEKERQVLIDEIKGLCEICKKVELASEVEGLETLDINSLKNKKTELEGLLGGKRAELASKVKFMLEFSPEDGNADNLAGLSNDEFASVYAKFNSNKLAGLVYDMVTKLGKAIADDGDTIAVWGDDVTPLELLGFESCDDIRKAWNTLGGDNIKNLSSTFNEWLKGKSWMKQEGFSFGKFFSSKKAMIKGTTFKECWDSKYKK